MHLTPEAERDALNLARDAIRAALCSVGTPAECATPAQPRPVQHPELSVCAGCFVSLHDAGTHRLRGCVGQLQSEQPLWALIPRIARACLQDPRLHARPVAASELPRLLIEITLVAPPVPIAHPLAFDPLRDGIVLHVGGESGCFLPQVARETGWDQQRLLERLCEEKLSLPTDAWQRGDARVETFATLQVGPKPFTEAT